MRNARSMESKQRVASLTRTIATFWPTTKTQVVSVSTYKRYLALQSYYSSNEVHYLQYYKKDNSKLLKKKFEDKNDTKYYYIIMNLVSSESDESLPKPNF